MSDDQSPIQSALNFAAATGGGTVWFPAGTYAVAVPAPSDHALTLQSGTHIEGEGRATVLKLSSPMLASGRRLLWALFPTTDVAVRNISLDGNKSALPGNEHDALILFGGVRGAVVEACHIFNGSGDGIYAHTDSVSALSTDIYVGDNFFDKIDRVPVNIHGAVRAIAHRNYITDSPNNAIKIEYDPGDGFTEYSVLVDENMVIRSGGMAFGGAPDNAPAHGIRQLTVDSNYIQPASSYAIAVGHYDGADILSNLIEGAAAFAIQIAGGTAQGAALQQNLGRAKISDNLILDSSGGGLLVADGGQNPPPSELVIDGNVIENGAAQTAQAIYFPLTNAAYSDQLRPLAVVISNNLVGGFLTPPAHATIEIAEADSFVLEGNILRDLGTKVMSFAAASSTSGGERDVLVLENSYHYSGSAPAYVVEVTGAATGGFLDGFLLGDNDGLSAIVGSTPTRLLIANNL